MSVKLHEFENNQDGVKGEKFKVQRSDALDTVDKSDETKRELAAELYIEETLEVRSSWEVANLIDDALPVKSRGTHKAISGKVVDGSFVRKMDKADAAKKMETIALSYQGGAKPKTAGSVSSDYSKLSEQGKVDFLVSTGMFKNAEEAREHIS